MDENILRKVKEILKTKFYATNDTWLRECVEYYLSEHDNERPNYTEVLDFVILQWQLSDLREISNEAPCLPGNLAREKCTTLTGNFILQMEKVYDISESKYKQLEKIRNVSNDNIEVTESEATQVWEPKKKRMLHFHLTDGAQNIIAIEYRPIRIRQSDLLPGYKLMIKGPVMCRRGIILLDETNVTEIGGEVENLLVPNALENVLARALNLEENPKPYSDVTQTNDDIQPNDVVLQPNDVMQSRDREDVLFDDDFDIDMEEVAFIETQSQERASAASPSNEWIDTNPVPDESANRAIEARRGIAETRPVPFDERTESDLLFDMIDDRIFESATPTSVNTKSTSASGVSSKNSKRFTDEPTFRSKNVEKPNSIEKTSKKSIVEQSDDIVMFDIDSVTISQDCKTNSKSTKEWNPIVEDTRLEVYREFNRTSSFENNTIRNASTVTSSLNADRIQNSETSTIKCKVPTVSSNRSETKESIQTGGKRSASVLSSPMPNQPAGKVRCTQITAKADKNNRKITDFLRNDDSSINGASNAKDIDNISDFFNAIGTKNAIGCKTVKAKVTNMNKLSKSGQCWELSATITDPTGSINAEFSSEILEKLLGFTVAEFSQKKKLKKVNPEIDKELREGFRTAENKLKRLNAFFKISLAPDKEPKIVEIIETSDEQKKK